MKALITKDGLNSLDPRTLENIDDDLLLNIGKQLLDTYGNNAVLISTYINRRSETFLDIAARNGNTKTLTWLIENIEGLHLNAPTNLFNNDTTARWLYDNGLKLMTYLINGNSDNQFFCFTIIASRYFLELHKSNTYIINNLLSNGINKLNGALSNPKYTTHIKHLIKADNLEITKWIINQHGPTWNNHLILHNSTAHGKVRHHIIQYNETLNYINNSLNPIDWLPKSATSYFYF